MPIEIEDVSIFYVQTEHIVGLLIAERDRLTRAIDALQDSSHVKTSFAAPAAMVHKRRPRTAAQRKAQSERMRQFWAARRKHKAK